MIGYFVISTFVLLGRSDSGEGVYLVDPEGGAPHLDLETDPDTDSDWYKVEQNSEGSRRIVIKHKDEIKGSVDYISTLFRCNGFSKALKTNTHCVC